MADKKGRTTIAEIGCGYEQVRIFEKDSAFRDIVHITQGDKEDPCDNIAVMVKDIDALIDALIDAKQIIESGE